MSSKITINHLMFLFIIGIGIMGIGALVTSEENASKINTFFAGILAIITLLYVVLTKEILEDSTKKRQMDFISKQLEELYYPLSHILDEFHEEHKFLNNLIKQQYAAEIEMSDLADNLEGGHDERKYSSNLVRDQSKSSGRFSDLINKKYLFVSNSDTKDVFNSFSDYFNSNVLSGEGCKRYYALKKSITKDIDSLEFELNQLTSN